MDPLRKKVLAVFAQWQKTAKEMREQNQPLNDNCIDLMRKEVETVFDEIAMTTT